MKIYISRCIILFFTTFSLFSNAQEKSIKPKLIGTFFRYYEKSMQAWQGLDSFAFTYDKQGNKSSIIEFMGDDSLYAASKSTFTYNLKNQISTQLYYNWDQNGNAWLNTPNSRATYTYNNSDSLITILSEYQDSLGWSNSSKWENTYDGNNNRTQELGFVWDTLTKNWSNKACQKFTMTYANNKLTSKTNYVWDFNKNQHKIASRTDYTYGSNGLLETLTNLVWDGVNSFHNSLKDSIIYDKNNQIIEEYGFYFDELTSKTWNKTYKHIHTYNPKNLKNQTIQLGWNSKTKNYTTDSDSREITFNYSTNDQLITLFDKRYDTIIKQFVDYNETYFYYEKDSIKVANVTILNTYPITVYPNPFIDKVQIKSTYNLTQDSKITLVNSIGESIHVELEHINDEITIYTNTLAKGVYYLHLENKEDSYLTKIIKI